MIKIFLFFLFNTLLLNAQTIHDADSLKSPKTENLKFNKKQLLLPSVLLTYGIIAIESDYLKLINTELRDELKENIDKKITIDDFSQYAPGLSVYALNGIGIKGKNNLKDRTIIMGSSFLMMSIAVLSLKNITKIERPDGSSNNSFPSGHTATAFAGAEFLWQEYKEVNIWYGIAGYVVATGTGFFRIYNGRHWLSDVAMGAGIGILSTKIAYWVFHYVNNHIFKSKKNNQNSIGPFYNGKQIGFNLVLNIH